MRWWGSFEAAVHDVEDHAFQIAPNVFGSNTNGLDSLQARPIIAALVAERCGFEVVSKSIDFDRDARGLAVEIEDVRSEWMLPPELQTFRTQSQDAPQSNFGRTHPLAELASVADRQDPSTSYAGPPPREIAGRM